jgi:pimeloyl-ACP methyl ester carboxylesterase
VNIGGVDQWLLIRGDNRDNPVLLMIHGGPGQSEIYLSHVLNRQLEKHLKGLWTYSLWLSRYGGKMRRRAGGEIYKAVFSAPEYSLLDKINFFRGCLFSVKHMYQELLRTDLRLLVPKVEIPVCFFLGKYDVSAPSELAEQYMEQLRAPQKKIVWFAESAHVPQFEEPEQYLRAMIQTMQEDIPI